MNKSKLLTIACMSILLFFNSYLKVSANLVLNPDPPLATVGWPSTVTAGFDFTQSVACTNITTYTISLYEDDALDERIDGSESGSTTCGGGPCTFTSSAIIFGSPTVQQIRQNFEISQETCEYYAWWGDIDIYALITVACTGTKPSNIDITDPVFINCSTGIPTLITLVFFTATELDSEALLEWLTASEMDNAGFNIWRSEEEDGEYVKINGTIIPADGSPTSETYYSYTDDTVVSGNTYYYRLEDIDTNGVSTFHDTDPVIMGAIAGSESNAGSAGGGGCFIATAAYGSYLDPHVNILREFRDEYLLTNSTGTKFVGLYDKYSPPMADFIAEHDLLRAITRVLLLPLVGFGAFMVKTTLIQKMLVMMVLLTLLTGVCVTIRRRGRG